MVNTLGLLLTVLLKLVNKMKIQAKNLFGGIGNSFYTLSDFYCPSCGKKEVFREEDHEDFYSGARYICLACKHIHELDGSGQDESNDPNIDVIIKQLKASIISTTG